MLAAKLLVLTAQIEIVEDSSSPDQLRDAFHSIAGEKVGGRRSHAADLRPT